MQAHHANYTPQVRHHAGSDSVQYRQLLPLPSKRSQPTHRYLVKDGTLPPQNPSSLSQRLSGSYGTNIPSSSTFATIDEAGNEILIEDRRSPPFQDTLGNNLNDEHTRRVIALPRPVISSYRRQPSGAVLRHPVIGQHVRERTSQGDVSRAHPALPPPPDPPILPLSNQSGGTLFKSVRSIGSVGGSTYEERTVGAAPSTTSHSSPSASQQNKVVRDRTNSISDSGARLLPPPPPPPTLRPRFPSILRKTDSVSSPTHTKLSDPSPLSQRTVQPAMVPRPPLSSRPLPPHRLMQSTVRAVPPHRLIKSLPLPVVPAPRLPKSSVNADSSSTVEVSQHTSHCEEQPSSSCDFQHTEKESVMENSDTLVSEDTEALRILAAVSEAAAAAVPNPVSKSHSKKTSTNNGDDDDDFEEEL